MPARTVHALVLAEPVITILEPDTTNASTNPEVSPKSVVELSTTLVEEPDHIPMN